MKISQFSVSRYRSIVEAEKIRFGDSTVLIGKNNEGKSNILRALNTAIEAIRYYSIHGEGRSVRGRRLYSGVGRALAFRFDWASDFPVPLQRAGAKLQKTRFRVDFELDDEEVEEFHAKTGLKLNAQLPVVIEVSSNGDLEINIAKPGKGSISFGKKVQEICDFIAHKIDFVYVPAVRTDKDAMGMIADLLRSALIEVEQLPEYKKAVDEIQKAQQPTLEKIAKDISDRLSKFIPSIRSVSIDTSMRRIYSSLSRDIELVIDDGVSTALDAKGDGIKSLVALSLFHSRPILGRSRIVAIEEPESHLHHGAVHELKGVLRDLSNDGQVIISTHNPSFIDRDNLSNVILVESGKAERVKGIERVRKSLGVLVSDNLVNSEFSIICEGQNDAAALRKIFSSTSPRLKTLIANGILVFDELTGASKLSYRIQTLNRDVFRYYVILDNDESGRSAIKSALLSSLLADADYSTLRVRGNLEAEIEDSLRSESLKPLIWNHYGLDIDRPEFGGSKKWSERMKVGFESSGKMWTSELEAALKTLAGTLFDDKPLENMREPAAQLFKTISQILDTKFTSH